MCRGSCSGAMLQCLDWQEKKKRKKEKRCCVVLHCCRTGCTTNKYLCRVPSLFTAEFMYVEYVPRVHTSHLYPSQHMCNHGTPPFFSSGGRAPPASRYLLLSSPFPSWDQAKKAPAQQCRVDESECSVPVSNTGPSVCS